MKRKKETLDAIYFFPICLILAFVPYIVHVSTYKTYMENYSWISSDNVYDTDLFLRDKGIILCVVAIVMAVLWIYANQWKKELYIEICPVFIYVIFVIFSTLSSIDKNISLHGASDQMEPVYVILSYIVVLIYCMYLADSERKIAWIQNTILISASIMSLLGIFQMFQLDFFRSGLGKWLIQLGNQQLAVDFNVGLGNVYGTLYNQNYIGSFTALFVPCVLCYTISTPKKRNKIIGIAVFLLLMACTFGANAKNAFISITCGLILLGIIYRKKLIRHIKIIGIAAIGTIFVFLGINFATENAIGRTLQQFVLAFTTTQAADHELQEIHTEDEKLEVVLKDDTLNIQYFINDDGTVYFILEDADGNYVDYILDDTVLTFSKETLSGLKIEPCMIDDVYGFSVTVDGIDWYFSNQVNDGTYYFYNYAGKYVKLEKSDEAIFTNCPGLFSGRGYIWAKTIPLLKKYFFIGSGPDTFQIVFPQIDYVDQATKFAPNMLVTRAHSMYLQTAVQTGVISLLCILVLYLIYFIKGFILYSRIFQSCMELTNMVHAGIGFYVGTFSYMISGITNDSLPVTAPLFWCLLGCGIATNYMLSKHYDVKQCNVESKEAESKK